MTTYLCPCCGSFTDSRGRPVPAPELPGRFRPLPCFHHQLEVMREKFTTRIVVENVSLDNVVESKVEIRYPFCA